MKPLKTHQENCLILMNYEKSKNSPETGPYSDHLHIPREPYDLCRRSTQRVSYSLGRPAKCIDEKTDISFYDRNRETLYNGLKELGFECIKPQGAFYLFVKSPVADEKVFVAEAKKFNILVVPGSSFACPGYVRIAYCVSHNTIVNSLPGFAKLAETYSLDR